MHRLHFAVEAIAFLAILVLGCGPKKIGSLCDDPNQPDGCETVCDPLPGAASVCPAGFHCAPSGFCDARCTPGGDECGEGYQCTGDGRCVDPDGGSGSNGPDANCPAINFNAMPSTPSIGLVLDQSGSMYDFTASGGTTNSGCGNPNCRFRVMREALVGAAGVVTQLETKAYFGASLYTCDGSANLITAIPRALTNAGPIRAAIDARIGSRGGNTPTAVAINEMVASFAAAPPPPDSPPVIVLATDGEPNSCNQTLDQDQYNAQSVAAAAASFAAGIPIYVLAINLNTQHFQDVANAGQGWVTGQPNVTYYPASNAAQMQAAFQTIINGVISCDLTLTSSIDADQAMNGIVTINGVPLIHGSDWILVNGNVIRLQGQACTTLKNTMNPTVNAEFPCGSVVF